MTALTALPSVRLTFYTRQGCKLCQQAEDLLADWEHEFTRVDIAGDEQLIDLYGHHVPVLTAARDGEAEVLHQGPLSRCDLPSLSIRVLRLRRGHR